MRVIGIVMGPFSPVGHGERMKCSRSCAPTLRSGISVPLRWEWLLIRLGMLQGKEEDVELLLANLRLTRLTQSYISLVLFKHSLAG